MGHPVLQYILVGYVIVSWVTMVGARRSGPLPLLASYPWLSPPKCHR